MKYTKRRLNDFNVQEHLLRQRARRRRQRPFSTAQGMGLAVDVKVILAPPCIFH
jgi:hypothetical protein